MPLTLVCNSHIDPVWLWRWQEGLAETLSTFRSAAALCEQFDGFVFCHNEALLYQWTEQYEPALFARIRDLVKRGRWHVMGGWYVQPDCNLPSGESLVRQALVGKRYFLDTFGVEPKVAVNLDPFGHGRGLVQILRKAGYDGYLFCRPDKTCLSLPSDDFAWVGYDGSAVLAHRASDHYNSELGKARAKVERRLLAAGAIGRQEAREDGRGREEAREDGRGREEAGERGREPDGLLLWGVGNHGGGPSKQDLADIAALMAERPEAGIRHGTPEDYFRRLAAKAESLPRVAAELNPWGVGCYTSMALVKRAHRHLESSLYAAEKMATCATLEGLMDYPRGELRQAIEDLLFCEFHDTVAGSSVSEVEHQAVQRLAHAQDIVDRLRTRAFFALLAGQRAAADGEYPIFVHNAHPFPLDPIVVFEMQPPEPNQDKSLFLQPELRDEDGREVPLQLEKESCNIQADQRKRLVFRAHLAPSHTTRLSCLIRTVPRAPQPAAPAPDTRLNIATPEYAARIAADTGLLERYSVGGVDILLPGAFKPLIIADSADPWGMKVRAFREVVGPFNLMAPAAAARFAGVAASTLPPVRVIEDGPVRRVIEALFEYERSALCLRYKLPYEGCELEVEARVYWMEKDRMLKLSLPTPFAGGMVLGQAAYGVERHVREAEELPSHNWVAHVAPDGRHALTIISDATHGFDFSGGELRLSLLRSPAYAGHPVDDVTPIVRQDRFEPRIDQGERRFLFWASGGDAQHRLEAVDREATARLEGVMALAVSPCGEGRMPRAGVMLSDAAVQLAALKIAETDTRLIVRLYEPTGQPRTTVVTMPALDLRFLVVLGPFEIKTLAIDRDTKEITEVDLLER